MCFCRFPFVHEKLSGTGWIGWWWPMCHSGNSVLHYISPNSGETHSSRPLGGVERLIPARALTRAKTFLLCCKQISLYQSANFLLYHITDQGQWWWLLACGGDGGSNVPPSNILRGCLLGRIKKFSPGGEVVQIKLQILNILACNFRHYHVYYASEKRVEEHEDNLAI